MIYIKLCLIANRHGRKILFRRKKQEDTKWNYVTMVLPSSYAVMDEEEMTYLEGGKEIANLSKKQCINGLCAIGLSPQVAIAGALTYTLAKCLINKVSKFGGLATAVVAGILTWAAGQVIAFGKGLARGALNNGVRVSWNWNPFKEAVGIGITVKY